MAYLEVSEIKHSVAPENPDTVRSALEEAH